ncbi:MAG: ATP-binding protein [Fibromonadales bacterium]|nr:ATP-binding protein [Fibromonadales bacterium]
MIKLIDRPEYLEKLKLWQNQMDLVKIVTGVRRCGKSKLFELFQEYLKTTGVKPEQIIAINFEDEMQTRQIGLKLNNKSKLLEDYGILLDFITDKLAKGKKTYIFLDEIQLLDNWQRLANTLRLQDNANVYLTGSNAYMFSSDLANSFGGRYIEIKMQPLSFKEYVNGTGGNADNLQDKYEQYTRESGFPQTIAFNHEREMINNYLLDSVYKNTVQKDIVQRLKIDDTARLDEVIKFLFDNIGNETSLLGVQRKLKSSGIDISPTTLNTYVKGLLDSYLMYKCERYDIKGKRILESNAKYYAADIGLRTALLGRQDADIGRALENIVYLELLRRGYQVCVGKVKSREAIEVDFVATQAGGEIEYYQVAWSVLGDPNTLRRELASLEEIRDNYPKYLLTMDYGSGINKGINRLNVLKWLLSHA